MKNKISTFGVCKNYQGKYYLVIDGKGHHNLSYSNKEFALKKAGQYAKRLHQTFTDNEGNRTIWEFENKGEVKELNYTKETATAETHYIPVDLDFVVAGKKELPLAQWIKGNCNNYKSNQL